VLLNEEQNHICFLQVPQRASTESDQQADWLSSHRERFTIWKVATRVPNAAAFLKPQKLLIYLWDG
jgi:hypothetical protein